MAILAFQKPDKVVMLEADNFYGKFELSLLSRVTASQWAMLCAAYCCHRSKVTQSRQSA